MSAKLFPAINLVGYKVSLKKLAVNKRKQITKYSIYAMVVFLVVFIPVLVVRFVFSTNRSRLKASVDELTAEISNLKIVETKYALLSAKSTALLSLETERIIIEPKILEVYGIMPQGTIIDDVSFDEGGNFLNLSVKAANVFAVGDLLESVSKSVGSKFSAVKIDSTKRDVSGVYKVSMELKF